MCVTNGIPLGYSLLSPVATVISIQTLKAPSVMMSSVIAMSIDYSLFLLSRYREELKAGKDVTEAVLYMTWAAGHTVLVSGSTLVLCFLSLMFFPTALLSSSGLGCAIAITVTILVNLTLTPALLLTFDKFFARSIQPEWQICGWTVCGGGAGAGATNIYDDDDVLAVGNGDDTLLQSKQRREKASNIQGDDIYDDTDELVSKEEGEGGGGTAGNSAKYNLYNELRRIKKSRWYKFAAIVAPKDPPYPQAGKKGNGWMLPWALIIVLVAVAIPCAASWANMQTTTSFSAFTPRTADCTKAFADLNDLFGPGTLFAYFLIIVPNNPTTSVYSPKVFADVNQLLVNGGSSSLVHLDNRAAGKGSETQYIGPTYITALNQSALDFITPEGEVDVRTYTMLNSLTENCTDFSGFHSETMPLYIAQGVCGLLNSHVSNVTGHSNAIMTSIMLGVDPFAEDGMAWLHNARSIISQWEKNHTDYTVYLGGGAAINTDVVDSVYKAFPTAMGITAAFVLIWIGSAFRSVLVPIRAVFTLAITIIYVYGCSVGVYQNGALDWLGFAGLSTSAGAPGLGALSWVTPVMSFSILVGLGLDYDVFLICRVSEYRQLGLSTRHAIAYGLAQTGPIITAAGAVMALAFAGLLFSSEPTLNELSFYLVFAVLFDTLVIRTMLVPALMSILGEANWYPKNMVRTYAVC
jgi:hypothetical protein